MERLAELISKLKEQFEQKADASKLLGITLLIERELTKVDASKKVTEPVYASTAGATSKVSVVMPAPRNGPVQQPEAAVAYDTPAGPEANSPEEPSPYSVPFNKPVADKPAPEKIPAPAPAPVAQQQVRQPQPVREAQPVHETQPARERVIPATQPGRQEFLFDPMQEIPTLAQQKAAPKEINELIGLRDPSLNDKLKENRVEIGHTLTEHPIRDLKKAIGINDRQIFINELFRGDEVMYERSLKTINGFKIYAEAEYWMERELKVKLGWEEHRDTTKHFLQLIKRRFA